MVDAGLAIASSVFGCGILVGDTLGCEVLGVVYGGLSVKQGIQRQRWLRVVGVLDRGGCMEVVAVVVCRLGNGPFVGCYDCVGRHVDDRAAGVVGCARAVVGLLRAERIVQRFRCPSLYGTL